MASIMARNAKPSRQLPPKSRTSIPRSLGSVFVTHCNIALLAPCLLLSSGSFFLPSAAIPSDERAPRLSKLLALPPNVWPKDSSARVFSSIWKYRIMVQMRPKTTGGLPSTRSDELILTSLIFLLCRNWSAVLALLRKCGLFTLRPLSTGNFSPDKTSSKASSLVPSFKSSIKSSIRSGGTRLDR